MSDGIARYRDFTEDDPEISFRIGTEVFEAVPVIPVKRMSQLANIGGEGGTVDEIIDRVSGLFKHILTPDSYVRFLDGLDSTEKPIGIATVLKVIPWLIEQYSLRPTEAPSGSVDSLSEDGASSTDGPSVEVVTYV